MTAKAGADQSLERLRRREPAGIVNAHLVDKVWYQLSQSGNPWRRQAVRTVLAAALPLICEAIAQRIEALAGLGVTLGTGPFVGADELIEKSTAAAAARHGGRCGPAESIPAEGG